MHREVNVAVKKLSFRERCVTPVLIVFVVMALSWVTYNLAWRLENVTLHRFLASLSGTFLFLSVAFGTLFVYPTAYFRGASLAERIVASLVNPLLWASKECARLCISFSLFESLYYYFNPLNVWLAFGVIAEMALAEMLCRGRVQRRGEPIRVMHPVPLALFLVSLFLVVALYAWGEGENMYVLFLEGYRFFFGSGTGVHTTL
jgi:hypothetical protein